MQDQEFERHVGARTIRVNVRLIAATNRDPAKGQKSSGAAVPQRPFLPLAGLSYRHASASREAPGYFAAGALFRAKVGAPVGKQIDTIPSETLNRMMDLR
jgi:hypothetical protein